MARPNPIVLIVDDDPEILASMQDLFDAIFPATKVWTATSATRALELLQTVRPDVIVSDYRMPDMDGIEFLRRSRAFAPKTTRLMMSAYADATVAQRAIQEAGVAFLVTKPFEMEPFVRLVSGLLGPRVA